MQADLAAMLAPIRGAEEVVVTRDRTHLHVVSAGSGRTVLLVHGYGASTGEWSLVQPRLVEAGYRVVAYDHRGHGRSTVGHEGLTAGALFSDLETVVKELDLRDAVIVAHSMGTFASLGALARRRLDQHIASVVLVSPETGDVYRGAPAARLLAPVVRSRLAARLLRSPSIGRRLARRAASPGASHEVVEATRRMMVDMPRRVSVFIDAMARTSTANRLASIVQPITVLWGTADQVTPRWHADLIVREAGAELVLLPGVGHMVNWEAPETIVNAVTSRGKG